MMFRRRSSNNSKKGINNNGGVLSSDDASCHSLKDDSTNSLRLNGSRHGVKHTILDTSNHSLNINISMSNSNSNSNSNGNRSSLRLNGSKHNVKHSIIVGSDPSIAKTPLRRSTSAQPLKGILRVTNLNDSLHSKYGSYTGTTSNIININSNGNNTSKRDIDFSVRSSQSDDVFIRGTSNGGVSLTKNQQQQQHHHHRHHQRSHSVLFNAIEIREYARTVGDNPSCSSGPPVTYVT
jgi:hypothetical protein